MLTKRIQTSYDSKLKAQAVKLAQEIGRHKTAYPLAMNFLNLESI
mgnify:CR=1 FL=1